MCIAGFIPGHVSSEHSVDTCNLRRVALACCACDDPLSAKELAHQPSLVTHAMINWALGVETKKVTGMDLTTCRML